MPTEVGGCPVILLAGSGGDVSPLVGALGRRGWAPHLGTVARGGRRHGPLSVVQAELLALAPAPGGPPDPRVPPLLGRGAEALAEDRGHRWLWADPGLVRTIGTWLPVIDELPGPAPRLVLVVDDPATLVPPQEGPVPTREAVVAAWADDLLTAAAALAGRRVLVVDAARRPAGRLPGHLGFATALHHSLRRLAGAHGSFDPSGLGTLPPPAAEVLAIARAGQRDAADIATQHRLLGRAPGPRVPGAGPLPASTDPWVAAAASERARWAAHLDATAAALRGRLDLPGGPPPGPRRRPSDGGRAPGRPVHVCTVHWLTPLWVEAQARALDRWLPAGSRRYAVLAGLDPAWDDWFDVTPDIPGTHAERLNALAAAALEHADDDDLLLFLDGDALPLAPVDESILAGAPMAAVRLDESLGDRNPHPCFCLVRAGTWRALDGDWREGPTWVNSRGEHVTDVGGRLLEQLTETATPWTPLLRSNRVERHPLWFGVYGDVAYHHGAGFRPALSRVEWQARADARRTALVPASLAPLARLERSARRRLADRRFREHRVAAERLGREVGAMVRSADDPGALFGVPAPTPPTSWDLGGRV